MLNSNSCLLRFLVLSTLFAAPSAALRAQAPGVITTVAGGGSGCAAQTDAIGDGCRATSAKLATPGAALLDAAGNLYIADAQDNLVRKVDAKTTVISVAAGGGAPYCFNQPCGPTEVELDWPVALALDKLSNLYVADGTNPGSGFLNDVLQFNIKDNTIGLYAGGADGGYSGDGGLAVDAGLDIPLGVAVDSAGNVYIADEYSRRIRKVNAKTGIITTVAGNGSPNCVVDSGFDCYGGDGGPATKAELLYPHGITVDSSGDLYIADTDNQAIRKVDGKTGVIRTIAGRGAGCSQETDYYGDGCPATSASLSAPNATALDSEGNLYIADSVDGLIRRVDAKTGVITSVAGNGTGCAGQTDSLGDGCPAGDSSLNQPLGIWIDTANDIYIADAFNQRIRKIQGEKPACANPVFSPPEGTYTANQEVAVTDASGCAVYYAVNGGDWIKYDGKISVDATETLEAYASEAGREQSTTVVAVYTLKVAEPVMMPAGGVFGAPVEVAITDVMAGATIEFSLNGGGWTKYQSAFKLAKTTTIEAYATASGRERSSLIKDVYTFVGPPIVTTQAATAIGDSSATLNATISGGGAPATAWFAYGGSETALNSSTKKITVAASAKAEPVKTALTGLKADTTYYYRAVCQTVGGTAKGKVLSVRTD